MRLSFRPIRPHEITEASALVDAAYAPQVRQIYGENSRIRQWRHYDEAKIESYVSREAEGVRVGVWRERLITLNICRSYGKLGWFHTLAVHPDFQQRGYGQQAVADAEAYLSARGVLTLALMTWPTAINNLAFYQRLGYALNGLTVHAYRATRDSLTTGQSPFYAQQFSAMSPDAQTRALDAVRALGQAIDTGLDYSAWVAWTAQNAIADTLLVWRDGQLQALMIANFLPDMHWTEGKLILLHPGLTLPEKTWALEHFRYWAATRGRDVFGLPVDLTSRCAQALLLPHHFRLFPEAMVSMVKGGPLPDPSLHFVRFGG